MAQSCSTMLVVNFVSDWVFFFFHWHKMSMLVMTTTCCHDVTHTQTHMAEHKHLTHCCHPCSNIYTSALAAAVWCKHGYCHWCPWKTLAFRNQTFNQPHPWTVWLKTWLKYCFTSTETVGTGSPGRPLQFSHSSKQAVTHFTALLLLLLMLLYVHRDHKDY